MPLLLAPIGVFSFMLSFGVLYKNKAYHLGFITIIYSIAAA